MNDDSRHDSDAAIGVGMGGSCPNCRAPVDLGQEFCLECGAPIRFSRKKQTRRSATATPATTATVMVPARKGFPWVPFLIVLALVIGGLVFALVSNGGNDTSAKGTTRDNSLSSITNTTPETSTTQTTTLQDCDPNALPSDGSDDGGIALPSDSGDMNAQSDIPQLSDPDDPLPDPNAIPQLGPDGTTGPGGTSVPDDQSYGGSVSGGGDTVTVDQNGNLCPTDLGDEGTDDTPQPNTTVPSTPSTPSTPTNSNTSWPVGRAGFTAIAKGLKKAEGYTQQDANQQAASIQASGVESGVLDSDDYASLCPGFWVVFSGVFTTNAQAEGRVSELTTAGFRGSYARPINQTGSCSHK